MIIYIDWQKMMANLFFRFYIYRLAKLIGKSSEIQIHNYRQLQTIIDVYKVDKNVDKYINTIIDTSIQLYIQNTIIANIIQKIDKKQQDFNSEKGQKSA